MNESVQAILEASLIPSNNSQYFWDFIDPLVRYLLLNQKEIQQLPFNTTNLVSSNKTYLNWGNLPKDVQNKLNIQMGSSLLYLTFEQWGWIDSNSSCYSGATFLSILPQEIKPYLPHVFTMIAPIQLDMKINLNYKFNLKPIIKLIRIFFKILKEFYNMTHQNEIKKILLNAIEKAKLALN